MKYFHMKNAAETRDTRTEQLRSGPLYRNEFKVLTPVGIQPFQNKITARAPRYSVQTRRDADMANKSALPIAYEQLIFL